MVIFGTLTSTSLPPSLRPSLPPSLLPSLPPFSPPSLARSIARSLTNSLTQSLTHSLTHNQPINQSTNLPKKQSFPFRNDNFHLSIHLNIHTFAQVLYKTFTHWRNYSFIHSFCLTISHLHLISHTYDRTLTNSTTHSFTQTLACALKVTFFRFWILLIKNYIYNGWFIWIMMI